jgi:hypothetical protein
MARGGLGPPHLLLCVLQAGVGGVLLCLLSVVGAAGL